MNFWSSDILGRIANYLTAFVSALLLVFNVTDVAKKPKTLDLNNYEIVFQDEFDGDTLNKKLWVPHHKDGLRKGGYWSIDQASVKDGCLTIRTQYLPNGKYGAGWYTAGIATKGTFTHTYGYYECRCILPKGEGMWSAFWLFNSNVNDASGTGTLGTEIDIFESPYYFLGGKKSWMVTSNLHYNGYELQTRYRNVCISKLDNDPYENFNTYGLLWTEDEYIYYVNGHEVGRSHFGGISKEPEFITLSCEVDGTAAKPTYGWSGTMNHNDKNTFTADFIVDYVRVYNPKK